MQDLSILPIPFEYVLTLSGAGSVATPDIPMSRDGRVTVEVVAAGANLSSFKAQVKLHPKGAYQDDFVDSDFASSAIPGVIRTSSVPPESLPAGTVGWSFLYVGLAFAMRFQVTGDAAGTITIRGVR